ncbi:CoA transferase [bacterium LRH843]|nr:CoA transferase [bacterium LRH843]
MCSKGPLTGIRVIEIAHHMAGPSATQKLGDLGADIIKIEPPGLGEWTRTRPIGDAWVGEFNTSLIALNRNKRSLTLNLKSIEGKQIFDKLIRSADVVVSNFRPTVHKKLGTDYESIKKINSKIIYCSITGFGEDGPYETRPGQDLIVQSLSGVVWNSGRKSDPPIPLGTFVVDAATGNLALAGITSALYAREKMGEGQKIEVNLLSSIMDVQIQEFTTYLNTGKLPERSEELMAHPFINSPYGIHRTKDGYIALAMTPYDKLAEALECDELSQFRKWEDGQIFRDEIFRIVADVLVRKTTKEWIEQLDFHDVWCGPVQNYEQVAMDPQIKHNGTIQSINHPSYGELKFVANPIKFSDTPVSYRLAPPELGEHNVEILRELGLTDEQISNLKQNSVIQNEQPKTFKI